VIREHLNKLGEDEQRRIETIRIIREWVREKPNFVDVRLEDYTILAYARGCKYNIDKIKQKLKTTLTMRATIPEFFSDWDPFRPEIQAALELGCFLPLLNYDNLGRKVIIIRPGCFDPYLHRAQDIEKANFMVSDVMGLQDEQLFITGMVIIIDFSGYSFGHLTQRPLAVTKKWLQFLQNAAPLSPKKVIFIHTSASFHVAYNLISRLGVISSKLKRRLQMYGSDFEALWEDVPQNILPVEYGGEGLSIAALTAFWKNRIENSINLLKDMEAFKSNESINHGR